MNLEFYSLDFVRVIFNQTVFCFSVMRVSYSRFPIIWQGSIWLN